MLCMAVDGREMCIRLQEEGDSLWGRPSRACIHVRHVGGESVADADASLAVAAAACSSLAAALPRWLLALTGGEPAIAKRLLPLLHGLRSLQARLYP